MRRRVLRGLLLAGAILALSGSASAAESAAPKAVDYPGAEDAGHIGCGNHRDAEPTVSQVSTANDAR